MNEFNKILLILGLSFVAIGGCVGIIFISVDDGSIGAMTMIPFLFVVFGVVLICGVLKSVFARNKIRRKGTKYAAKIYSYVENHAYMVNNSYLVNTKVHYFNQAGIECEATIPTNFTKGSDEYPIGMTIDIYEFNGRFDFDKNSVRMETLPREDELMDDKPIDRGAISMVAISCPSCGASYQAMEGYSAKCPYCGGYQNA